MIESGGEMAAHARVHIDTFNATIQFSDCQILATVRHFFRIQMRLAD